MNLFNLQDKVAIVTGASRGIGRSIAFQLARDHRLPIERKAEA